jgi:hypothetical protein
VSLSLLAAALMPLVTFACLWPLVSPIPIWDQWSMVEVFDAYYRGKPVLPLLLANYNGHWSCVPRTLFFMLGVLTHWDLRSEVFLNYGAAVLTQLLLLRMLYEARPGLLILAAPVSAYVYSFVQYANFISGYPATNLMTQLSVTGAIYMLTRWPVRGVDTLYAMLWAIAALFCNSIAAAVAPVGMLANLVLAPRNLWRWLGWTLVTVAALSLPVLGAARMQVVPQWRLIAPFALAALGNPFTWQPMPALRVARFLGAAAAVTFVLLIAWRWRRVPRPFLMRWAGLGLFACGSAALLAFGRAYSDAEMALAPHYVAHTSGLAVAIVVLAGDALEQRLEGAPSRARRASAAMLGLLVAGTLLQTGYGALGWMPVLRVWHRTVASLSPKVADGSATDAEIQKGFHPDTWLVRWGVTRLHRHRLAWFKDATPVPRPPASFLPDEGYRVEWVTNSMPRVVKAGSPMQVEVTVRNVGIALWPDLESTGDEPRGAIRLAYRWIPGPSGSPPSYARVRGNLLAPLPPGKSATLGLEVVAPPTPGAYHIQFDLVQEFIAWFESMGATRLIIPVQVLEGERHEPGSGRDSSGVPP